MANTTIPSELIADGAITSAKLDTNIAVGGTLNVSGAFTSLGIDDNATSTAITIDSSQNVLVGTTDTFPGGGDTNTGVSLTNSGAVVASRDGDFAARFNRKTSDGEIIGLNIDGVPVGSIGSNSGYLYVGGTAGNDAFLSFGADGVRPATSAGAARDAAIDLGGSTNRFKDLYLSGGVVFGATGGAVSSKTLDDYEEGTWTGTATAGASSALSVTDEKYTKIGNQVTIQCTINFSGASGALNVTGIPFAPVPAAVGIGREDSVLGYLVYGRVLSGTGDIDLFAPATANASPFLSSAGGFRFSMTYLT